MIFEHKPENKPLVSIILLDWSCRESFHFLHYINNQVISRQQYEVIWIEFYDRQAPEIETWLKECGQLNKPPVIDKWIVMEMPKEYYYHKHLMYNLGVLYSSGDIIVICDSDGIVRPTFIQSIVEEFSKEPDIVLHMDQLRNMDRKYHPYNYPSIDEIETGSVNLVNGKPLGLVDTLDTLHNRNYGACFCAKRNDIIAIGGADEHIDYLGHICGPYDLTFRLVNAGKKEKWHQTEWMYHVWHPGQSGDKNYVGPHDGRNMSTLALNAIATKRISPLWENELIKRMRQSGQKVCEVSLAELTGIILHDEKIKHWKIDLNEMSQIVYPNYDHDISLYTKKPEPEISVILPSLRPEKAHKCIESIAATSKGVNYEVVVVSPLDMCNLLDGCKGYERIKFVQEEKKEGCNQAYTNGYEKAAGKYIFAIADDHRLGQDCLKNLIGFMQPHDEEIFLAGARCYGVYGPGPENTTYGFYYAYTPCIRRNLVADVSGFYDPYYKHYYGDPDLAMRVWHNGGKVELCLDAWVEYHNELDNIDLEAQTDNSEMDFNAFFERWHPIYGHLAKSCNEKDINVCNNYILPGIPPEKCTRLVMCLRNKDWSNLENELDNENNFPMNKDHLSAVFKEMMISVSSAPGDITQNLSRWLIKQLFIQTSLQEMDTTILIESVNSGENKYNPDPAELFPAIIAMFYISGGLKKDLDLVINNYKGVNILYGLRKFFAWPCSFGGFTINIFENTSDKLAFCEGMIYQALKRIDGLLPGAPLVDLEKMKVVEEYFSSNWNAIENNQPFSNVIDKMPNEICLHLLLYLKLKDWSTVERLLNDKSESMFIIENHLAYVYGEVLKNMDSVPPNLVSKLSQWLWGRLEPFFPQTKSPIQAAIVK
ncbi:MAG: glycosyltransferase [Syntrophomonas sp.]